MGKKATEYAAGRINCIVGSGTEFEGTLRTKETTRIEGFVKGTIISEGTLIIGNGGKVEGKVEGKNIFIGGEVRGELYSQGKIEANSTGRIFGNIHTKRLIIDENAIFQGQCEMLDEEETKEENKEN